MENNRALLSNDLNYRIWSLSNLIIYDWTLYLTSFFFSRERMSLKIFYTLYPENTSLRDKVPSRNCSFTYFTACHACSFVLFSCHTNEKSARAPANWITSRLLRRLGKLLKEGVKVFSSFYVSFLVRASLCRLESRHF